MAAASPEPGRNNPLSVRVGSEVQALLRRLTAPGGRLASRGAMIDVTHFTDPGCPWAYSASPALTTLRWRFGDGLRWRLVTIGLAEDRALYEARGYSPATMATGWRRIFARYGMPLAFTPKADVSATSPGCRAIVATRLDAPGRETEVLRALQFRELHDDRPARGPEMLRAALARVPGLDADALVARIDDADVRAAYEADRAAARTAAGSPTEAQGRAFNSDGAVRYTAPSLVFTTDDGRSLEAGGFQPLEAYDVVVANLDPTLARRAPAEDPVEVLAAFEHPLATAEIVATMVPHLGVPDPVGVELALIAAVADGRALRIGAGNSALWALTP